MYHICFLVLLFWWCITVCAIVVWMWAFMFWVIKRLHICVSVKFSSALCLCRTCCGILSWATVNFWQTSCLHTAQRHSSLTRCSLTSIWVRAWSYSTPPPCKHRCIQMFEHSRGFLSYPWRPSVSYPWRPIISCHLNIICVCAHTLYDRNVIIFFAQRKWGGLWFLQHCVSVCAYACVRVYCTACVCLKTISMYNI